MGLFVNSNLSSLNAQRSLNKSTIALGRSFERLSSGLRINGAKDDAAGLSITTRFSAQIKGLNQAVRNSNDGISLAQTAEGALNETTNILQRMRELAVQSANDTNNSSDRASLNAEILQLKDELDRIAETTNFNGNKVLDGNFLSRDIQVGANVGETIDVTIAGASTTDLGRQFRETTDFVSTADALVQGELKIKSSMPGASTTPVDIRAAIDADDQLSTSLRGNSAIAKAAAINSSSEFTGVRAIVGKTEVQGNQIAAATLDGADFITINNEKISGFEIEANDASGSLRDAINAVTDKTGVIATLDKDAKLILTAEDGRNIHIITSTVPLGGLAALAGQVEGGRLTLQSDHQFDANYTASAFNALGIGGIAGAPGSGTSVFGVSSDKSVNSVTIDTREAAIEALDILDLALEDVSASRANLGALQNRLESTINNLNTTAENLSASRSRILDADFASETAMLSRNQIIQQAAVSILAQANQQPSIALSLLG